MALSRVMSIYWEGCYLHVGLAVWDETSSPNQVPPPPPPPPPPTTQPPPIEQHSLFPSHPLNPLPLFISQPTPFDGDRMNSFSIHECWGRFKGSNWVDWLGGEWIIACTAELHQDFVKKHFYKCLCKSYKFWRSIIDRIGGVYHSWSRHGCWWVTEGVNRGGWALFEMNFLTFILSEK